MGLRANAGRVDQARRQVLESTTPLVSRNSQLNLEVFSRAPSAAASPIARPELRLLSEIPDNSSLSVARRLMRKEVARTFHSGGDRS
jgi:hypothetical protein